MKEEGKEEIYISFLLSIVTFRTNNPLEGIVPIQIRYLSEELVFLPGGGEEEGGHRSAMSIETLRVDDPFEGVDFIQIRESSTQSAK